MRCRLTASGCITPNFCTFVALRPTKLVAAAGKPGIHAEQPPQRQQLEDNEAPPCEGQHHEPAAPALRVGIVGFGNFGQFIAAGVQRQGHAVMAASRSDYSAYCTQHGIRFFRSVDELSEEQPDVLLICSSILSMESVVRAIPFHKLRPDTTVADVLSVKQFPRNLVLEVGHKQNCDTKHSKGQSPNMEPSKRRKKPIQDKNNEFEYYNSSKKNKKIHSKYDLTADELATYSAVCAAPMDTDLAHLHDAQLPRHRMDCLIRSDGWLMDIVIDAYVYCLREIKEIQRRKDGAVLLETTLPTCYLQNNSNLSIQSFAKYLDYDMVFLPINYSNLHWYLAVVNARQRTIQVLDSMGPSKEDREELTTTVRALEDNLKQIEGQKATNRRWKDLDISEWTVVEVITKPLQTDSHSCGLFTLKFMEFWTGQKLAEPVTQDEMHRFRKKLVALLMHSKLNKLGMKGLATK